MTKNLLKEGIGWGIFLWLVGYILGIILFFLVPQFIMGWIIMPIGVVLTLWILNNKIRSKEFSHYLNLSAFWTVIAIIFDYFFIVKALKAGNYYKLDIYIYYALTFLLPIFVGLKKGANIRNQ